MAERMTAVACPVCGTHALYTPGTGWLRHYHDVRWMLDVRGQVVARWITGDGAAHEVVAAVDDVYCQGCHTRVIGPAVWQPRTPAPWPRVFFQGA